MEALERITKEQALEIIKNQFDFTEWENRTDAPFNFFHEKDGVYSFYIDKRLVMRHDVVKRLYESFGNTDIEGYQVRVERLVLLYTIFHLEPRKEDQI